LLFDYPTPAILAEYLRGEVVDGDQARPPVLEELDKLEGLLASVAGDDERRAEIAARLAAIMHEFRAEPASDRELETASNEEIFDLVDQELNDPDLEW
jgi:hypothetical protein